MNLPQAYEGPDLFYQDQVKPLNLADRKKYESSPITGMEGVGYRYSLSGKDSNQKKLPEPEN